MSDLSATVHNFEALLEGKTDFNGFISGEGALIEQNIKSLPAEVQGATTLMYESLKIGAAALVGAGLTAIGPILAESTDTQATQVLNLMQLVGIPTVGPLSLAEHAVLVTFINGLKAGLDKIGIEITTTGGVTISSSKTPAAASITTQPVASAPTTPPA